ncbi:MAG: SDR family NAD(P)-dependent oxidoreductase, partial [Bacteroidia bacterium]
FAMGRLVGTKLSQLDKMFKLNFETAYNVTRVAFEQMSDQENGGKLFFIGSRSSFDAAAGKNMIAYTLSKSLLTKLSELINAEGKKKNITSSILVPSVIDTPSNREAMPDADFDTWVKPEKIADILLFLCSETADDLRESVVKVYGNV